MKRLKARLRNRNGSAMVFGIIVFLVLLMLGSAIFVYSELKITTAEVRNAAQNALDTCTATESQTAADSLKNGTDYTPALDANLFTERLQTTLGIGNDLTGYRNGKVCFRLSDVVLTRADTDGINVFVRFTIREPLYFCGKEVSALNMSILINSRYNPK